MWRTCRIRGCRKPICCSGCMGTSPVDELGQARRGFAEKHPRAAPRRAPARGSVELTDLTCGDRKTRAPGRSKGFRAAAGRCRVRAGPGRPGGSEQNAWGAGLPGRILADVVLDGFVRALDGFEAVLAGVAPGRWEAPSPCEGWSAADVA